MNFAKKESNGDNNIKLNEEKQNEDLDLIEKYVFVESTKKDDNVFIEYDNNKVIEKLLSLKSNDNHEEKLQYISRLGELITIFDEENISKIPEIFNSIIDDSDECKKALCFQFDPLITFFLQRAEKGYYEIIDDIIPAVSSLLQVKNFEIKRKAGEVMATIANLLNEDDRGKYILTICLNMSHDDDNEDNRVVAVQLLSSMATHFGKDLCEQFVALEFLSLGEDPHVKVRKEVVKNLPHLGQMVSQKFFKERLLPFFLRLCKDPTQEIKISCLEIMVDMAKVSDPATKQSFLTDRYLEFFRDTSKDVRILAYLGLGQFIAQFQNLKVNEKLIDAYLRMPDINLNNPIQENEIAAACAYYFPGVLLTLGSSRWPQLNRLFMALMKKEPQVRKPLACALHEIARIVGEEKTETELFAILKIFLKDKNDEIRYGAIKNLGLFLEIFKIQKRETMADYFCELQRDSNKWRIRELIADQIEILATIFKPETVFQIIAPISFKLCADPVSIVRERASSNIHTVFMKLYNTEHRDAIIETIKGFSQAQKFSNRQAFIHMCDKLMDIIEVFEKSFLKQLVNLGNDKVINVRLCLSRMLKKKFEEKCPMVFNKDILLLIQNLQLDPCFDVRSLVEDLDLPLPESYIIQNNYKKNNVNSSLIPPIKSEEVLDKVCQIEDIPNVSSLKNDEKLNEIEEESKIDTDIELLMLPPQKTHDTEFELIEKLTINGSETNTQHDVIPQGKNSPIKNM